MSAVSLLQLDPSLGGFAHPPPLSSSRYPPNAADHKRFHFHQQQRFRASQRHSLLDYARSHNLPVDELSEPLDPPPPPPARVFSPSVSPSHALLQPSPSTPRSLLANSASLTLSLSLLAPSSHLPLHLHSAFPTVVLPPPPHLPARPSRMPSFRLDKFLTSHQHLSTPSERVHVTALLKKDARLRTPADVEAMAKFLQTIDAFAQLSLPVCVDLARHVRLRRYNREEIIYREGDDATSFYVIMTGAVGTRVTPQLAYSEEEKHGASDTAGEGYIAGIEHAGASLGADSFSAQLLPRHSSTRMAIERCELLVLDMSDYATIVRLHRRDEEKQRMHVLKHVKAFELCTAEELWHIAQHMQPLRLSKNQIVFTQGEPADKIFFVSQGECRAIYTTPHTATTDAPMYLDLGRLRAFSFFGELGMFAVHNPTRTCTVYAETSVVLYAIAYDGLRGKAPKFVVEGMREWGDTLYAKEDGEMARMMKAEERWLRWKGRMMDAVRPQEILRKEAERSGKWMGRAQMLFK